MCVMCTLWAVLVEEVVSVRVFIVGAFLKLVWYFGWELLCKTVSIVRWGDQSWRACECYDWWRLEYDEIL